MRKLTVILLPLLFSITIHAQITEELFISKTELSRNYQQIAGKYQALELNTSKLDALRSGSPSEMDLSLPFENGEMKLQLKKVSITADNFSVMEVLPGGFYYEVSYSGAIFYQGKIKGLSRSMATISIVGDQVMGIISDDKSNIILGAIEEQGRATEEYALYRETDLKITNPQNCFTSDEIVATSAQVTSTTQPRLEAVGAPVDIYFECDYKFYQDKGSNTINVINYVLGFFNTTALLYANENVKIQVSQIVVWTTQDPEAAAGLSSSSTVLNSFSNRMSTTSYIGDYAHFLSTRSLGGGIAWLTGNCPSKYFRSSTSAINNTYSNFPLFSWTVEVVTHELGHNLGSHHTHWCGWPGGPIDGCGPTANAGYAEGACGTGPIPANGSIMSYCHLLGGVGINFNNGFGALPGQAIRDFVTASPCMATCQMTIEFTKLDASCGQNNGTATVSAINSTGALTYLWSNGQTGASLINAAPGTYHVTVTDAAGCQVIDDVVIGNSGTTLTFALSPATSAGFCAGGNITLTASSNPAYTYVWRRNGVLINGAITNTYTANSAGTYAVTANSGVCIGTQSVVVSEIAPPVATISANGATVFCEGGSISLDAGIGSSYSYQWYNNGVAINAATSATYSAIASGNYSVRVSAGNTCQATSPVFPVTVNPSPKATVTATGSVNFCSGNSVLLSAYTNAGYTHQWFNNNLPIAGATQSNYIATLTGSYTVTSQLGSCSKTSPATVVTVLPSPVVSVTPLVSTIHKFHEQTLTASGALSYNWSSHPDLTNTAIDGKSASYRPLTTTDYPIQGAGDNGCKTIVTATINVIGCGDVTNFKANRYSPSRVLIEWVNPQDVTTDTLQYRKVGAATWTRVFVTGQRYELNGLEPDTDYEYNVIPLCNTTTVYVPSATQTFRTESLNGIFVRLFPNPVQPGTRLEVISSTSYTLSANVYDQSGRMVMTLITNESLPAGQSIRQINAAKLASGVYHIVLVANGKPHDIKMSVIK
jgi:hypothetical protein